MWGLTSYSTKRTATSAEAAAIHVSRSTWGRPPTQSQGSRDEITADPLCPHALTHMKQLAAHIQPGCSGSSVVDKGCFPVASMAGQAVVQHCLNA